MKAKLIKNSRAVAQYEYKGKRIFINRVYPGTALEVSVQTSKTLVKTVSERALCLKDALEMAEGFIDELQD